MELLQSPSFRKLVSLLKLDLRVIRVPLLVYAILMLAVCFYPAACTGKAKWVDGTPVVYAHCYRYLQFYPAILIAFMSSKLFEETFRKSSHEYMHVLGLRAGTLLAARTFFWWAVWFLIELPAILIVFAKVNLRTSGIVPAISLEIPVFHCAVAYAAYMAVVQFLLALFREKSIPISLFLAYCALESGSFHIIFGSYSIFCGSFNQQDYYHFFPANITVLALIMPVLFCIVFFLFRWNCKFRWAI